MAEEKYPCKLCGEPITEEDEVAEVRVRAMNWETHADCMDEVLH